MRHFSFYKIIKEVDLFGKEPDIYYKGKQKKTTWMGRILSWIYISFYIFFFIYKLIRMFKRVDVSFSETNGSTGGLPFIHLTKENFIFGLSVVDEFLQPLFDETIYSVEGNLKGVETIKGVPKPIDIPIIFDRCDINDFGKNFQKFTKSINLNYYYCPKNFDVNFEGYNSAENFTSIIITLKKCKNKTKDGTPCKNDTEIKNRINRKTMHVFFEDFDLTPFDYKKPVKEKLTLNTCPIRMDEFQTFVGYFQLVNIETENNLFGFEAFSDIKSEKYIIYHSTLIMNYEMIEGQAEVSTYNILLKENTLNNLRTYTQFIDVLGDVGGLMEVIQSIFGIICTLVADILYDKTMVNNLFTFDLNTYSIKIKNKPKLNKSIFNEIKTSYLNNEKMKNQYEKKEINISKNTSRRTIGNKKQKFNLKKTYVQDINIGNIYNNGDSERNTNSKNISSNKMLKKNYIYNSNKEVSGNIKIYNYESPVEDKVIDQRKIINKIKMNLLCIYFCFCIVRKRENLGNAVLDEAMNIITDKLDIYNMFRNFYFIDEFKENNNYEYKDFEMSDECKSKLKKVSNKFMENYYHI